MAGDDLNLNVRLSLLEQDMKRANNSLSKMEETAEKHREQHSQITEKIYGRMEDLRTELKTDMNDLKEELKTSLEDHMEKQNEVFNRIETKLNELDKWRWIVVGIAAAVGFIVSKVLGFFH